MSAIRALVGKDLRDLAREKSILAALLVQFFVAAFSTFLTVGLLGLYDPSSVDAFPEAQVAYAGEGAFADRMAQAGNLDVRRVGAEAALEAFRTGSADAVVQESTTPDGAQSVTVLVADGTIQATLLLTQLKSLLGEYEDQLREERAGRLQTPVLRVDLPDSQGSRVPYAFAYATLLPLLVVTPVFLSGAIAADSFVHELQGGTLPVLRSAPISGRQVLLGKLLVPILLAPAQVLLWVGLLRLNGFVVANLALLLAATLLLAVLVAGAGVALAAWLGREGPTQAAYALAVIAAALASLLLPNDPFNAVARIATGGPDAGTWTTLAAWAAAAAAVAAIGLPLASRRLRDA